LYIFYVKNDQTLKNGKNIFLLCRNFTYNNSLLKNEARTQKYFSKMALEQNSLANPDIQHWYLGKKKKPA